MGLAKLKPYLSIEEYLSGENDGAIRHEYIYGEVYAMASASDRHNQICGNFFVKLFPKFNGSKNCQVFMTDMKLQADEATFYYPDVFVACDKPDPYFRREPILIVEVLSSSTENTDRREKLKVYLQIPSLEEYAIAAQDEMRVEIYRKKSDETWQKQILTEAEEVLELKSVELNAALAEIYQGVDFAESLS
ncbi:MAG: Uma2 family endonuclease [Pyrinomonadaceae bacterium]